MILLDDLTILLYEHEIWNTLRIYVLDLNFNKWLLMLLVGLRCHETYWKKINKVDYLNDKIWCPC